MMFFKRLFTRKAKPDAQPARGVETQQTQAEQDTARQHMESDVADDRARRGATDVRPGSEQPPTQDPR